MTLKLGPLPDRETAKITFTADADLKAALNDYAEIYRQTYGKDEGVAEQIPFMLNVFMNADPGFKRARRQLESARPYHRHPNARRVGMKRFNAFRSQVSPSPSPNRTCRFPGIRLSAVRLSPQMALRGC